MIAELGFVVSDGIDGQLYKPTCLRSFRLTPAKDEEKPEADKS
jgi:hypothetical protein